MIKKYSNDEEGLMYRGPIDKCKLKKLIRKFGKINHGK